MYTSTEFNEFMEALKAEPLNTANNSCEVKWHEFIAIIMLGVDDSPQSVSQREQLVQLAKAREKNGKLSRKSSSNLYKRVSEYRQIYKLDRRASITLGKLIAEGKAKPAHASSLRKVLDARKIVGLGAPTIDDKAVKNIVDWARDNPRLSGGEILERLRDLKATPVSMP